MDNDSMDLLNRNEIENLIIAAEAASGEEQPQQISQQMDYSVDPMDKSVTTGLWRSPMLDLDQINAIKLTAQQYVDRTDHTFHPEAYSKKMGSVEEYQEMISLVDFKGEPDHPEKIELMRKYSMIFKPTGPQSRVFTQYEQAVNEAAYHICCLVPAAIFQKRNLAIMAKTVVRKTGLDFPNARANYFLSAPLGGIQTSIDDEMLQKGTHPALAAPASAVYLQQRGSGFICPKKDPSKLDDLSMQVIADTAIAKAQSIPSFKLKTREQCTLVENYVYTDAQRIMKYTPEQMDEAMEYIREVSAIYGRYPSGPSMPEPNLSPYEQGMNEAATWLVRCQPALLIHRRNLTDLAKNIIYSSGLHLTQTTRQSNVQPYNHPYYIQSEYDSLGSYGTGSQQIIDGGIYGNGVNGIGMPSSTIGPGLNAQGVLIGYDEDEPAIAVDNQELIRFLGGAQAIAQFTDTQLDDLGRAQFTVVDPRTEDEMANTGMDLQVEEDDKPLDEMEILRVSGCKKLENVEFLRLPACGYTSISAMDLACCVRLRELDLAENALRVFPRRLHLPRLRLLNLAGNRFFHIPLVEQFPELTKLYIDERLRQQLNAQMLSYFCPKLKQINDQFFEEVRTEFTNRIVQEARVMSEPHIRAKWESDLSNVAHSRKLESREAVLQLAEKLCFHLKERGSVLDDSLLRYRDLMMFRFVEDFLRSKFVGPNYGYADDDLLFSAPCFNLKSRVVDDSTMLLSMEHSDKIEERSFETRIASERALFDAADELMGLNIPDFNTWQAMQSQQFQAACHIGPQGQQLQAALVVDSSGRVHQQPIGNASSIYPFHLGRSLRLGRSIVMTVVRPKDIQGRPVAEFLPGELRNKDYVKGYMASEIYKKAVKDQLGQKFTPKKKIGAGRPRKPGPVETSKNGFSIDDSASKSKSRIDLESEENVSVNSTVPPKKRKALGLHRSLRDLYSRGSNTLGETDMDSFGTTLDSGPASTIIDYDPLHFIRCHAKDNDAGDSETKVWRCLFEPNPLRPDETTHVVATCGGECVCLINCETGKVLKRFKHIEEEFYCIAWTTVEVSTGKRANILAAAGKMHEIRLLHPEQLVCYAEMKGHTDDVTAMIFHQTQPTILFSGDAKASVLVWDIGVPSVPNYKTRYQLLMRLRCPRLDVNPVLNLVFLPHYAFLIAGCEDGLFAWKVTELRLEKREREPDMELRLEQQHSGHEVCIDGLAQLSDNSLVMKVVESGEILVFDFTSVLERRKGLQRVVPIETRGHLLWQKTDEIYINVSVRQNLGAVVCGDNEGSIWIYDLDPYLDDLHSNTRKQFHVKPIKILEWPECSVQGNRDEDQQLKESISSGFRNPVVNSVELSSDGHYLVAVTDNNLVCIWRYAPPVASNSTATKTNEVSAPQTAKVESQTDV